MMAGVTPFRGDTALSVALQHLKSQPDRLENLRPDLPVALSRIVHKMLAKDPGQRYATTRDLLRDLRDFRLADDGGDWPDDAADLLDIDTQPLASRGEATQRLDALMKTSGMRTVRSRPLAWAVACLIALAAGGALAWFAREPFLLADTGNAGISDYDTARELFTAAQFQSIDSEVGYRGVIDHFPKDRYFVPRAKQELAWLYLTKGRRDEALVLFEELAASDEAESRAFGLAGQGIVLTLQGDYSRAAQALAQLPVPELRGKIDRRMFPLIQRAMGKNQKHLSKQTRGDLEELIKQMPGEEDFAPTLDDGPQPSRDNGLQPSRDRR